MAYWREELRIATFRGVPFYVEGHDLSAGRRTARHVFPGKDLPYVEDLGRKPREYHLTAYVIGEGYFSARDALLDALEAEGPGDLVHPFLGSVKVVVMENSLRENFRRGGMASFSIAFVEYGESIFLGERVDYGAIATQDATNALAALMDFLGIELDLPTDWFGAEIIAAVSAGYDFATDIIEGANDLYGATVGELLNTIREADAALSGLIGSATGLASNIFSTFNSFSTLISSSQSFAAFNAMLRFGDFGDGSSAYGGMLPPIPGTTNKRETQQANQDLVVRAMKQAATIEAGRFALITDLDSYDQGAEMRSLLDERLDELITEAADDNQDDAMEALETFRASMIKAMNQKGANLARIVNYPSPATVVSALSLSYALYGVIDREQEIIDRNFPTIEHPGFLPKGETLEVLNA